MDTNHTGPSTSMPNLGTQEGLTLTDEYISSDTELIIIDNLSSLVRSGKKENEAESWDDFEQWLLKLRAAGKSILIIHHAGKNGAQRGTSKREDLMDTIIQLRQPTDHNPNEGACFEVHFEKTRSIYGFHTEPFLAKLVDSQFKVEDLLTSTMQLAKISELKNDGLSQTKIAQKLGVHKSTVSRALNKTPTQFQAE